MRTVLQNIIRGIRLHLGEAISEGNFGAGVELVPLRIHLSILLRHQLCNLHQRVEFYCKILGILVVDLRISIIHGLLTVLQHGIGLDFPSLVFTAGINLALLITFHSLIGCAFGAHRRCSAAATQTGPTALSRLPRLALRRSARTVPASHPVFIQWHLACRERQIIIVLVIEQLARLILENYETFHFEN